MKGWNREEVDYLKNNYSTNKNIWEIKGKLNRSIGSIKHKAIRLGLSRPRFKKGYSDAQPKDIIDKKYYEKHRKEIYLRRQKRVRETMRELKLKFGGKCNICGYNKSLYALDFHHLRDKDAEVYRLVKDFSKEKALKEVEKCVLICANCHREEHFKGM